MFLITGDLGHGQTEEAFLREYFTVSPWRVTQVAILGATEGRTDVVAYVLCEQVGQKRRKSAQVKAEVLIIFLKDYDYRRVEGKVYREEEFPHAFDCPPAILDALLPSSDFQANAWRAQCRQRAQHPLQAGDVIAFAFDLPFPQIKAGEPLTVLKGEGASPVFLSEQGTRYKILLWWSWPYTLLASPPALPEQE